MSKNRPANEIDIDFSDEEESAFRKRLIKTQNIVRKDRIPVVAVFCGVGGSGRDASVMLLRQWLDPRGMMLNAYEKSQAQDGRGGYQKYWNDLPKPGIIGAFMSAWYAEPLYLKAAGKISEPQFEEYLERIRAFEKTLADNGYLIIKNWLGINAKDQKKYLESLEGDPLLKWMIKPDDWDTLGNHDAIKATASSIIKATDTHGAKWNLIEGDDIKSRVSKVLTLFCDNIKNHKPGAAAEAPAFKPSSGKKIAGLDQTPVVGKKEYEEQYFQLRCELNALFNLAKEKKKKIIMVFEGPDASGKGGVITRVTSSLNVRDFKIVPISAPTAEEKEQHYLWRFYRPLAGQKLLTVFDRSWYGRVLVERIEKFATEAEWQRAYREINEFESDLANSGSIVVKFLLYITNDEQLERFKAREETEYKEWKITEEDWRNRDKWGEYETAFEDMVTYTDTRYAPWHLIPSNNKKSARVMVMRILKERLAACLNDETSDYNMSLR